MKKSEIGSILPFVALFMAVVAGAMLLLAYVTATLMTASRAQTAADAAALAGASRGRTSAEQAAAANDAELTSFSAQGDDTVVMAKVGSQTKTARARTNGVRYLEWATEQAK